MPHRTPQRTTPRTRSFELYAPRGMSRAILHLPEVRRLMVAERREMICQVVPVLKLAGLSQNRIADLFNVHRSELSEWLRRYARGGLPALVPRPMGRQSARRRPTPGNFKIGLV